MHVSAILMILDIQSSFLMMIFKWRHVNLSDPGVNESLHLLIADLNLNLENGLHFWGGLQSTLLRMLRSTCWWRAVLKELWREFYKFSGVRQGQPLCLITSITGSFLLLTQFINSQEPRLLFAISWILSSKKICLAFLTVILNDFQFSWLLDVL